MKLCQIPDPEELDVTRCLDFDLSDFFVIAAVFFRLCIGLYALLFSIVGDNVLFLLALGECRVPGK